jgi:hypothetical protein
MRFSIINIDREYVQEMPLLHPLRSSLQQKTSQESHQETLECPQEDSPTAQGLCQQTQGRNSCWNRVRSIKNFKNQQEILAKLKINFNLSLTMKTLFINCQIR